MTNYKEKLLLTLKESFASGNHHYSFDIPKDPEEYEKLLSALQALEDESQIMILQSPALTGDDFIEVQSFPPCCKPHSRE